MLESLAHRGTDGSGAWVEGPVGLGHQMLHTTPESLHENQPLVDAARGLVLTADARIDNREELTAALGMSGRPHEEITDADLILGAYARWGERCPERLLGDFAFAIWDRREQRLFCARDHFGVRQLYFYRSERLFAFATEIKGLLCLEEVPRKLNEVRLADYLVSMVEEKRETLYRDIYRLPPAEALIVDRKGAGTRGYWALDPTREVRFGSDAEYGAAFREIFTEAVRCRLRSAGLVGSALSGGLDSSSITCVARDLMAQDGSDRLHTFSGIYDEVPESDERPYIDAVLARGGVEPHFVHPDRFSPLTDWDGVRWCEDEPLWNPQMALHWAVCQAAQRENIRVLLDGTGGDDVVSHGLPYLAELARTGRWVRFLGEAYGLKQRFGDPFRGTVWSWGVSPLVPKPARRAWRRLRRRGKTEAKRAYSVPIRHDFAERIGLEERIASLEDARVRAARKMPGRLSRKYHWLELTSGLQPWSLATFDRYAALFHIEPRLPFYDRRLAEFCLAVPPEQKIRRGWTRMIMRRALTGVLPEQVRWRGGKADLSWSFHHGMLTADRETLHNVLVHDPGRIAEYVDPADLRRIHERYLATKDEEDGFFLWRVTTLALWLRRTRLEA